MRSVLAILTIILPALLAEPDTAGAQGRRQVVSDSSVTQVRLRDGTVLYGRIVAEDSVRLTVRTTVGAEVRLTRDQVRSIRTTDGRVVDGEFWPEDPNGSRLTLSPTARPLARGEGYLSTYFLFLPFVGVGITDRLSVAAGTPLIPEIIGRIWYANAQLTVHEAPGRAVAIGALAARTTEGVDDGTAAAFYGSTTLGDRNNAVTLGAGLGMTRDDGRTRWGSTPVGVLGLELRPARRVKIISENWFTSGGGIVSGGLRFLGERLSADLGLLGGIGGGNSECCIPTVNFMWAFGKEPRSRQ